MPEHGSVTIENNRELKSEDTLDLLCEQFLPRVFQYTSFYIHDNRSAEEITLDTLRQTLVKNHGFCNDQETFLFHLFTAARQAVYQYLRGQKQTTVKGPEQFNLQKGLDSLSNQGKEVVALKIYAGLTNLCIGRILRISEPVVRILLCKSLSSMQSSSERNMEIVI